MISSGRRELPHLPGQRVTGSSQDDEHPWSVRRELGRGSASVVHLAVREDLGDREYALKRLRDDADRPDAPRPREQGVAERLLRREAALLASVDHPGLTRVHAVERVEGRLAIVMDVHDGTSLADLLPSPVRLAGEVAPGSGERSADAAPRGPLSVPTTVRLALDVCDALDALHRSGLVHRDVRPANVLVTPPGRAVLVDLGVDPGVAHPHAGEPCGERTGEHTGEPGDGSGAEARTLRYRAPEQAGVVRSPVDHRADLYSLGALLLECLTERPPVEGTDAAQVGRSPVEVRGEQLRVTVSIGVAELRAGEQLSDVLARADTALYRAKSEGRDRVVLDG